MSDLEKIPAAEPTEPVVAEEAAEPAEAEQEVVAVTEEAAEPAEAEEVAAEVEEATESVEAEQEEAAVTEEAAESVEENAESVEEIAEPVEEATEPAEAEQEEVAVTEESAEAIEAEEAAEPTEPVVAEEVAAVNEEAAEAIEAEQEVAAVTEEAAEPATEEKVEEKPKDVYGLLLDELKLNSIKELESSTVFFHKSNTYVVAQMVADEKTKQDLLDLLEKIKGNCIAAMNTSLENKEFGKAYEYAKKVLEYDPKSDDALIGSFIAQLKVSSLEELSKTTKLISSYKVYGTLLERCSENGIKKLQETYRAQVDYIHGALIHAIENKMFDKADKYLKEYQNAGVDDKETRVYTFFIEYKINSFKDVGLCLGFQKSQSFKNIEGELTADEKALIDEALLAGKKKLKKMLIIGGIAIGVLAILLTIGLILLQMLPENTYKYRDVSGGVEIYEIDSYLDTLVIPETLGGKTVVSIGNGTTSVFTSGTKLKQLQLPSTVKTIKDHAFEGHASLQAINLGGSVKEVGAYAFKGCSSLTKINVSKATKIGVEAFRGCTKLATVSLGSSLESIGDFAFTDCTSLTKVDITLSVKKIGSSAFYGCKSLTIYTEYESASRYWANNWNFGFNGTVVWGATGN